MLTEARPKNIYRDLWQADLTQPDPERAESYDTINAAGVLNPMLRPGGLFAFSLNDHAVEDGTYEGRVHILVDSCAAELMHREYGTHMPAKDLKAWVYVLKKR